MGVFASKSLCLDRRLQDRPGIRDLVIRLLDILVEALEEVTSNNEPHQNQTMSEPEFPLENKSEIDDLTEDIETSLVSLSRLGTTIRKYSTTGRTARIRKFAEQSASLKAFEKLARVAVDTLYMEAKDTLRAQLTRSMVETCASILYKKSHQKKMNTNRPTRDVPMPTIREERDDNLANSAENFNIDDPIVQILPDSAPKPNQLRPYAPLESTPSILDSLRTTVLKDLGRSSKVKSNCSASSIQLGKVSYPRASGGKDASGYRTCKWCLERHPPALFDSKKQWSAHLDKDFEPYVCLSESCMAEIQLPSFATFKEWLNHMNTLHTVRWQQEIHRPIFWVCNFTHKNEYFSNQEELHEHMKQCYPKTLAAGLPAIVKNSHTKRSRSHNVCPLCCRDLEQDKRRKRRGGDSDRKRRKVEGNQDNVRTTDATAEYDSSSSDEREEPKGVIMARHIAEHLQISMLLTMRLINCQQMQRDGLLESEEITAVDTSDRSTLTSELPWPSQASSVVQPDRTTDEIADPQGLDEREQAHSPDLGIIGAAGNNAVETTSTLGFTDLKKHTAGRTRNSSVSLKIARHILDEDDDSKILSGTALASSYFLGRIGEHYIAVSDGTSENSPDLIPIMERVTTLLSDFPSIKVLLLVGVGHGMRNSENNIRCDDIAVGVSDHTGGGVVHDHGNIYRVASNSDTYNELQKRVAKWSVSLADLPPLPITGTTVASTPVQIAAAGRSSRRPSSTNGIDLENDRLTRQNSISPALPCHVIQPPKNPYFVGRGDILEELEANLISNSFKSGSDWDTRAFAIWGPPGVGKSQTALHFAYTHEKEFPSILFTGADTETKLLSDLAAYSQTIGLTTEDQSKNLPGQVRRLLEWYETTDVRWLLIFDNARSIKLITDYWPISKVGAIIITSRSPQFGSNTVAGAGKELKSLHDEEAIQLLEKQLADQSTTNFDRNEALQIVRRMENLPLGIQASVGLINDVQCSLRDFNRQWTSPRDVIMDSTQDHTKTRFAKYPKALGDAWLDALSALRPESRAMIDVMALLDPDNIQEEIFEERVSLGYPSTMPFLGNKTKCLGDLRSQGLLSYGGQSQSFGDGKSYINIHHIIEYPTQSSLKTEGTEEAILNEIIEIRYLHACISTETAEFEESLEHFELAKKSYEKFEELGYVKKNSTRYMTIVGGIADSLTGLRRNKEAEVYYLECIELAPPGNWQPYDINICRCLWDTGIPEKLNEGADRLNTWIATRAAMFGPDDQYDYLSGQAKYVLGNIRISQGKYDEAFELHMSTVKNFKAVLGDDDHKTGDAYHKAGWHFDRIGNYEEAKKYLKNALKVYQLGSDATYRSGEIARTTFKLSLVLAKMGRTQKAEDERKTAEVFRQKSMGRKYFPSDEESEYDHLVSLWAR
ncbi:hypothetical protein TWF106_010319 [Orbilia oligospora]|uniref:NB-ARC domain-containing protein n=1 Tax=Orbilia oligospora TaxID=2813651 RepID=A0A7C8UR34_ORBOL|nr:hypothetical protein TWF106_010319 [Orbilia oligospora]